MCEQPDHYVSALGCSTWKPGHSFDYNFWRKMLLCEKEWIYVKDGSLIALENVQSGRIFREQRTYHLHIEDEETKSWGLEWLIRINFVSIMQLSLLCHSGLRDKAKNIGLLDQTFLVLQWANLTHKCPFFLEHKWNEVHKGTPAGVGDAWYLQSCRKEERVFVEDVLQFLREETCSRKAKPWAKFWKQD
jgi:hypothetical protein